MMFNELVLNRLNPIFLKHNLHLTEQFENYVKLRSGKVTITFYHDSREKSSSFEVGENEDALYPVTQSVIKEVFKLDIRINNVTPEVFVNNLAVFFEGEGSALLKGDSLTLNAIEKFVNKKSEEYTNKLVDQQNLDLANKAWQEGNFEDFIKYIDRIGKQKLPSSYAAKYTVAQQKL